MTANSLQRNLILDIDGHNVPIKVGRRQEVTRTLTLINRSDRPLNVDLWIKPHDDQAAPLREWCRFSNAMPRIDPEGQQRIILTFEIPLQAASGFYSYDICAEPRAFPGEIAQRSQQLELQPSEQEIALRNEPIFRLNPPTSSEQPYELKGGNPLAVQVVVENHSRLVDRFFLTCPELPPDWFDIKYPEINESQPGQRAYMDGLQLNPEGVGTINLTLNPPPLTAAGHYSTTLRLTSDNQDSLVLLDILYFIIHVSDGVTANITPKMGHIPGEDSDFTIALQNQGNIHRNLTLTATDGDRIFDYTIAPNPIQLSPGKQGELTLIPKSRKWWRRQWKKRQEVRFQVEIWDTPTDTADWELLPDHALFLPKPLEGKFLWESYPAWLRWLLKGLLILLKVLLLVLLLTIAAVLARYTLKLFIVDPRLQPRVLTLETPKENYVLKRQNPIQLDFEISNSYSLKDDRPATLNRPEEADRPEDVDQESTSHDPEDSHYYHSEDTQPIHYLQFTFLERNENVKFESDPNIINREWLKNIGCQETVRPFGLLFRMAHFLVYPSNPYTPHVLSCQGLVIPQAKLIPSNRQASSNENSSTSGIENNGDQRSPVRLIGANGAQERGSFFRSGAYDIELSLLKVREEIIPKRGDKSKKNIPFSLKTIPAKMGAFLNQSLVSNAQEAPSTVETGHTPAQLSETLEPLQSKKLKNIQLVAEAAEISYFYSKDSNYRNQPQTDAPLLFLNTVASDESSDGLDSDSEGSFLLPERSAPVTDASVELPSAPIKLNWIIDNPLDVKALELSYILIEANGNIQPQTTLLYSVSAEDNRVFTTDGLVVTGCQFSIDQLVCQDVPTNAIAPGEYRFTLKAIMADTSPQEDIALEADPISIRSPYPEILSFKVNGQEVSKHPQQVHMLNPAIGSVEVMVEWKVANPDQVTVELQPSPGLVASSAAVPFSVLEGNTVLTLQVSNEAGEIAKQSVTISAAVAPAPRLRPVVPLSPRLPSIPVSPVPTVPFPAPPTTVQPKQPPSPEPLQVPPSGN